MKNSTPQTISLRLAVALWLLAVPTISSGQQESDRREAITAIKAAGGSLNSTGAELEVQLHLRPDRVDDRLLEKVAQLDNVVLLNLRDTTITDASLVHVAKLTNLRWLRLERTSIGDKGTSHLADLAKLESLNLYETKITDETLVHLSKMKSLQRLYLWKTDVTDEGVAKLQKQLPKLKINRGIDLASYPTFEELVTDKPKPKIDLKWILVAGLQDVPKSLNGLNTQVIFQNASGQLVKLYWVSYANELKLYAELKNGDVRQQNSYSRNSWLITDSDDQPLGYFVVEEEVSRAIIPKID